MKKMTREVLAFASNDADRLAGYENFVEYFNAYREHKDKIGEYTMAEADKKMLEFFTSEVERYSNMKASNYADLAIFANFTAVKEAAFAIIGMVTDLIIPDVLIKDLGSIATIANGGWGDTLKIDIKPRDLFVVSKGGRAKRSFDIKRQWNGTETIVPEPRVITVGISLYDILTGKYSLAEFVTKTVLSMENQMRTDIYDTFAKAMDELAGTSLAVTGYTQDTAVALAQKIQAWNGGTPAVFLGTKLALSKILPASTNYRFQLGDEYTKLGHVRDFFGFDTIELEQIADMSTEFGLKLPDNKIFVISPTQDKLVKCFIEGSTLTHVADNFANANLQVETSMVKSYGVGVATSAIAGVITLN